MNRSLRTACLLLATAFAAIPVTGCALTVDGNKVTAETLVRYEGSDESLNVAYVAGQAVRIISPNGNVDVVTGGGSEVQVTFSPFTMDKEEERDRAVSQIENKLDLTVSADGEIVIKVGRKEGSSGYLGADIRVVLPTSFDGEFEVDQNNGGVDVDLGGTQALATLINSDNGSIDVSGARGRLSIFTDNGGVDVNVAAWSSENGSVKTGNGDLTFRVPADVNGTMTASADGTLTEQGIPATWATAGEGSAKSYTMNTGEGGQVDLVTDFGDIALIVK